MNRPSSSRVTITSVSHSGGRQGRKLPISPSAQRDSSVPNAFKPRSVIDTSCGGRSCDRMERHYAPSLEWQHYSLLL